MTILTQSLRDEHKELFPSVDQFYQMVELTGDAPVAEIRRGVEEVYLPILDQRLTPESAQEMFEAMEDAVYKPEHAVHAQ